MQAANATPGIKHVYTPEDIMEVISLLPKMCRVIKGDSEGTKSSRTLDCETIRHMAGLHTSVVSKQ